MINVSYYTAVISLVGGIVTGPENGPIGEYTFESNQTPPTEEQIQSKLAELTAAEPLRQLRQQRNQLLAQTDWMAVSDRVMTQTQIDYRQALRDITTQTPSLDSNGNLTGITWPTAPTD